MAQKGWKYGSALSADKKSVRYFSPSALMTGDPGTTEGCIRKYAYQYVHGLKSPPTKAQELGTQLHAENEQYLLTGDRSGMGSLALSGLFMLPEPQPKDPRIHVEWDIAGGTLEAAPLRVHGVPIVGSIDCIDWQGKNFGTNDITDAIDPPNTVSVTDWKTSSSEKWIKSPKEVASTLQMTTYGKWAVEVKKAEWVRLSHGYYITKGKHLPRKVSLRVHKDQINERWGYVENLAKNLIEAVKEENIDRVPANTKACDSFGGCLHRPYCSAAAHNSLSSYIGDDLASQVLGLIPAPVTTVTQGQNVMNLLSQLKVNAAKPVEGLTKEAEMERLAREDYEAKYPGILDAIVRLESLGLGMPTLTADAAKGFCIAKKQPPSESIPGSGELGGFEFTDANLIKDVLAEAEVIAKDRGTTPAQATVTAPLDPFPTDAPAALASPPVAEEAPGIEVVDAATAMQVAAGEPAKKPGRGRPKKKVEVPEANIVLAEGTPVQMDFGNEIITNEVTNVVETPSNTETRTVGNVINNTYVGYTGEQTVVRNLKPAVINFYVDAITSKPYESFWPYVNKITDAIAQKYQQDDYRVSRDKNAETSFGAWKGMLAAGIRALHKAGGIPGGNYMFDNAMSDTGNAVIEAMRAIVAETGGEFVRGVR